MKFYIPKELSDTYVRDFLTIDHGELRTIDALAETIEEWKLDWLTANPGWTFTGADLVKCADGSPSPAYDVHVGFRRPLTPAENQAQTEARNAYLAQKEADFRRREAEQKSLLAEVLSSLEK